jgi:hypothetical protein
MDSLEVFFKTITNEWIAKYHGISDVTGLGATELEAVKSLARGLGNRLMTARETQDESE